MIADLDALVGRAAQYAALRGPCQTLAELESAVSAAYIDAWLADEVRRGERKLHNVTPSDDVRRRARAYARLRVARVNFAGVGHRQEISQAISDGYLRGTLDRQSGAELEPDEATDPGAAEEATDPGGAA